MNLITFSYFAICKQANPRIPIIPGHEIFFLAKWNKGTKTGGSSVKELESSLKTNELEKVIMNDPVFQCLLFVFID
jgi:hypothetical protein